MRPLVLAIALFVVACRNERPDECQRLRQCCTAAAATGTELEEVRVACSRADDTDAVLCRRRLEQVQGAVPSIADRPECRLAP